MPGFHEYHVLDGGVSAQKNGYWPVHWPELLAAVNTLGSWSEYWSTSATPRPRCKGSGNSSHMEKAPVDWLFTLQCSRER